jgi:hypothetical protein
VRAEARGAAYRGRNGASRKRKRFFISGVNGSNGDELALAENNGGVSVAYDNAALVAQAVASRRALGVGG